MTGSNTNHATTAVSLHTAIADLVRSVYTESRPHPEDVLERFALLAVTHIPSVQHAGVMTIGHDSRVRPSAATGGSPHVVDMLQEETQQGPALAAVQDKVTVRVDDVAVESRWPHFIEAVLEQTSVRSMLCYRLYTDVEEWGVLGLYADSPGAFDGAAENEGDVLATHAAMTLQAVQRSRQFRSALGSRDIIGQAKGILMERYGIGAGAAFALLTKLAKESNHPVVAIAKDVVEKLSTEPR
jgi:GAF domain-containing protein